VWKILKRRSIANAACFILCLAVQAPSVHAQGPVVTQNGEGSVTVNGIDEGAAELKAILSGRKGNKGSKGDKANKSPVASRETSVKTTQADYDADIAEAMKNGEAFKAAALRMCKGVAPGSTVVVAPAIAAAMRQYCIDRDFNIAVDPSQLHKGPIRSDPPASPKQQGGRRLHPDVEACRKETLEHVITCAKVTDYLNCEMWGCPEIIQCDKRLTTCDDHGSPYNQSGTFYCDTRNWRTRDFDLDALLQRTCPAR